MDEQEEFEFRARAEAEHAHAKPPGMLRDVPTTQTKPLRDAHAPQAAFADAATSLVSGAVAAPLAGLAGIGQGIANLVDPKKGDMSAADRVQQVQGALTYQPRTKGGQALTGAVAKPFELLAKGADYAGDKATQGATALGASAPVAGSIGATVNTVLQAAPSAILPELGGKGPLGARIAARRAEAPRIEPTVGPTPGAAPQPGVSATPGPRPPGSGPDQVPFTPDSNAPQAPKQPMNTPARQTAAQRAESYVRDRVGVDWNSLSAGLKATITDIAKDAESLDKLDPNAVSRKARLDAANIKGTRGQVTRDLSQLTKEENLVKSKAGRGIRDIKADQDTRLHELVDEVKKSTGATAETREQLGKSVQDTALRAKLRASKANYDKLYKAARETEPEARVAADPMYAFVRGNPEVINPAATHLDWLRTKLKKMGIESEGEDAEGNVTVEKRPIKLTELDDLRKKALSIAKGGGDNAHYAGEVIKAIDEMFDSVPDAATAWKQARDAFKAHKTEYDEQGIIKKLATDKSRTDRRLALEKTVDSVLTSSSEDIGKLKASLTEGHFNDESAAAGAQAWKDVQGGVIDKLKEAAQGKREIANEQGVTQFNSAFRDLFNELDKDGKIDAVFSPEQAKRLRDINKLVEDLRTTPSGRVAGSDTVPRLVSMLDKVGEIPGLGGTANVIAGGITKLYKAGEEGRQVRAAQADPLEDAAKGANRNVSRRRSKASAAAAAPIAPVTIGEQLQNERQ